MGPEILFSRFLFATPAHVLSSAILGYYVGVARFAPDGKLATLFRGLVIAAILQGIYNFLVAVHPKTAMISLLPLMAFMAWLATVKIERLRSLKESAQSA